jgi:hypothetical protein
VIIQQGKSAAGLKTTGSEDLRIDPAIAVTAIVEDAPWDIEIANASLEIDTRRRTASGPPYDPQQDTA